ncbi:MAG: carbohydrate kinase family protein [bacterium]
MARVNCIGILVVDALSGPLERYPEPHSVSQVNTKSIRFAIGGGAANTGGALAKMGIETGVFSKVGDDANGVFILRELEQCGVDTRGIKIKSDVNTPFTFVGIHPGGERTFIHTPGTNMTFNPADVDRETILAADYLLYQDCWVLPGFDGEPGAKLLAEAKNRGIITFLDECWGLGPNKSTFEQMLPFCDYVMPSFDDMLAIYPGFSADEVATRLLNKGAKTVILKLGAKGCLVCYDSERIPVPAYPANVVDTTGAGDCWNAGFIAALAHGEKDLLAAAKFGSACASFCIGSVGGMTGIPDYITVKQRADSR